MFICKETTQAKHQDLLQNLPGFLFAIKGSRAQGPCNPRRTGGNQGQDSDIARSDLLSSLDVGASRAILVKRPVTPG